MMKEEGRDCTQELLFYLFLKQQEKKKKKGWDKNKNVHLQ